MKSKLDSPVAVLIENLEPDALLFDFESAKSALENLNDLSIDIAQECGGMASCGTCLIWVKNPELLEARNEVESQMAEDRGFKPNERLSCQTSPVEGLRFCIGRQ